MAREKYIQIGVTALRNPDGSFQPSVPLYIRGTEEGARVCVEGFAADAAGIFAPMWDRYMAKNEELAGVLCDGDDDDDDDDE